MSETNWLSTPPKFLNLTAAATMSVDPTLSVNFIWTPGEAETVNFLTPGKPGQELTIILVSSGTSRVITLGTYAAFAGTFSTPATSGSTVTLKFVSNGIAWYPVSSAQGVAGAGAFGGGGSMITKQVNFTENATNTIHTGTVPIPAGAWLHGIEVTSSVLWGAASAVMKVGDTADDDGYFVGVDLKATDLLVGEILMTDPSTSWGGKEGAYLVAATGRRGPAATNFSKYYAAGSNITGIITVGTPAVTTGRTHMMVKYSLGENVAAVATGP